VVPGAAEGRRGPDGLAGSPERGLGPRRAPPTRVPTTPRRASSRTRVSAGCRGLEPRAALRIPAPGFNGNSQSECRKAPGSLGMALGDARGGQLHESAASDWTLERGQVFPFGGRELFANARHPKIMPRDVVAASRPLESWLERVPDWRRSLVQLWTTSPSDCRDATSLGVRLGTTHTDYYDPMEPCDASAEYEAP
jgi:hypothetical protein